MKPFIKDMNFDFEIKNKGIEIQVNDNNGEQLGDLYITKSKVIWCEGKTAKENGLELTWNKFIKMMKDNGK